MDKPCGEFRPLDVVLNPLLVFVEEAIHCNIENEHHPEKNLQSHLLQCYRHACRETHCVDTIIAALVHDVGKMIQPLGHEQHSVTMIEPFVARKTLFLVENHMRVKTYLSGEMNKWSKVVELNSHPWFAELVALHRWDLMARNPRSATKFDKDKILADMNRKAKEHFI